MTQLNTQRPHTGTLGSPVSGSLDVPRSVPLAGDILYGADEIAEFLFGDRKHRRRVYNLVESNRLPSFRIGINICARKSILLEWIAAQEDRCVASATEGTSCG